MENASNTFSIGIDTIKTFNAKTLSLARRLKIQRKMPEAFTISKLLDTMNECVGNTKETDRKYRINLQRRLDNGVLLDTSKREIACLDTQSKIKHGALQVAQFKTREERMEWMDKQSILGKRAFQSRDFIKSSDIYMQTLAGLDFGTTKVQKRYCIDNYQIPITCNIISCMLVTQQWNKAVSMCDVVIALSPVHVKALQQRARANMKLGNFDAAKLDLEKATVCLKNGHTNEGDTSLLNRIKHQLRDVERARRVASLQRTKQCRLYKDMMLKSMGRLYEDKKDLNLYRPAEHTTNSSVWKQNLTIKIALLATIVCIFTYAFTLKS